jgi:hypothetical protein
LEQQAYTMNILEETINHFQEGARSVRAYTDEETYVITKVNDTGEFWITREEPGYPKTKVSSLEECLRGVFGIEARY